MPDQPTLYLLVGLPGSGKTTLALEIEAERTALRLSPDEWMLPLFGASDPDGLRDVLEGRLLWVAHRALRGGLDVVVDFGLWGRDERAALADLARHAGARCQVLHCQVDEKDRRARIDARWSESPDTMFAMDDADHTNDLAVFVAPDQSELAGRHAAEPPPPHQSWGSWAADRWPSLPAWEPAPR